MPLMLSTILISIPTHSRQNLRIFRLLKSLTSLIVGNLETRRTNLLPRPLAVKSVSDLTESGVSMAGPFHLIIGVVGLHMQMDMDQGEIVVHREIDIHKQTIDTVHETRETCHRGTIVLPQTTIVEDRRHPTVCLHDHLQPEKKRIGINTTRLHHHTETMTAAHIAAAHHQTTASQPSDPPSAIASFLNMTTSTPGHAAHAMTQTTLDTHLAGATHATTLTESNTTTVHHRAMADHDAAPANSTISRPYVTTTAVDHLRQEEAPTNMTTAVASPHRHDGARKSTTTTTPKPRATTTRAHLKDEVLHLVPHRTTAIAVEAAVRDASTTVAHLEIGTETMTMVGGATTGGELD